MTGEVVTKSLETPASSTPLGDYVPAVCGEVVDGENETTETLLLHQPDFLSGEQVEDDQPSDQFNAGERIRWLKTHEAKPLNYLPCLGLDGYFVQGWSHVLAAFPKTGKTELLLRSAKDWPKTMYLSEEPQGVWDVRLAAWNEADYPLDNVDVRLCLGKTAEELLAILDEGQHEYEVVIIDSTRDLLQLESETENSKIATALRPFVVLCRRLGKTLIFVHHEIKAGGKNGRGVAGGHAFVGAVDVFLQLEEGDAKKPTQRKMTGRGRVNEIPNLIYEKRGDAFVPLADQSSEIRILAALSPSWQLQKDIEKATQIPTSSVKRHLEKLAEKGIAERDPPLSEEAQGKRVQWRQVTR